MLFRSLTILGDLVGAFLAGALFAGAFFAGAFFVDAFLAGAFFSATFLAGAFFTLLAIFFTAFLIATHSSLNSKGHADETAQRID